MRSLTGASVALDLFLMLQPSSSLCIDHRNFTEHCTHALNMPTDICSFTRVPQTYIEDISDLQSVG